MKEEEEKKTAAIVSHKTHIKRISKAEQKKRIKETEATAKADLVYPKVSKVCVLLLYGGDLLKW